MIQNARSKLVLFLILGTLFTFTAACSERPEVNQELVPGTSTSPTPFLSNLTVQEELPEEIINPSLVPTLTLLGQDSTDPEVEQRFCSSEEINPIAESIARTYEISYDAVMELYCDGYEFEEILLALETEEQSGFTAKTVLSMRDSGLSWDEIWKELGVTD